jgi:dTMP kinase
MYGKLYVFEGIDGAGKSSAVESVANILNSNAVPAVAVKNITKGPLGVLLRDIINHKEPYVNDRYIANLFLAELHNVVEEIKVYLDQGIIVLCDRWFYSTIAYLDDSLFSDIVGMAKFDIKPDLTFYIDVKPDVAIKRLHLRGDNSVGDVFTTIDKAKKQSELYSSIMLFYSGCETFDKHCFKIIDGGQVMSYVVHDIIAEIAPELIQEALSKSAKRFNDNSHYGTGLLDNQESRLTARKEFIENQNYHRRVIRRST